MMSAVTYSDPEVQKFIEQHFIPVQINTITFPDMPERFHAPWTPTVIILDHDGHEHRRLEGYLDPHSFKEELALAEMKTALDNKRFADARKYALDALAVTRGDLQREPEARYWAAVADYKQSHDAEKLKQGWNDLVKEFPESEWARRASVFRQ